MWGEMVNTCSDYTCIIISGKIFLSNKQRA
nr:MAG TPA: hypothetical protein [Caudoviricetes sp.]DAZ58396.1 MAG TPA: hypothetical protein [Caudoviricetes sp.]